MKRIVTSIAFVVASTSLFGQGGVVSAPVLELQVGTLNANQAQQTSIQSTMSSIIASMETAEKNFKEAMTKATWMRNLQAVQRLVTLVENLICTSKDLNIKLSAAGGNCLYSYQYDMVLVKMQMSADYLGILMSGVSMTVGERSQMFKTTVESFEQSQNMMIDMNNSLDADIARSKQLKAVTQEVTDFMTYDRRKRK